MIFTASLHPSQTWLLRQLSFSSQRVTGKHILQDPLVTVSRTTVEHQQWNACFPSLRQRRLCLQQGGQSLVTFLTHFHIPPSSSSISSSSLREHSSNQQGSRSLPPFSKAPNARSHRATCCLLASSRSAGFPSSRPGPVWVVMVFLLPRPFNTPATHTAWAPPHSSPGGCVESWACTLLPPQHSFCHPLGLASVRLSDCPALLAHLLYVTSPIRSHSYPPGAHPFPQILQNPLLPVVGRWVSKRRKPMTGSVSRWLLTAPICYSASNTPFPRRQCRGISRHSGAGVSLCAPLCWAPPLRLPTHPWPPHKAAGPWPMQCVRLVPREVPVAPRLLAWDTVWKKKK